VCGLFPEMLVMKILLLFGDIIPIIGLWNWGKEVCDQHKIMSRRWWQESTFKKFKKQLVATGGLAVAGKKAGNRKGETWRSHWFALLKVTIRESKERLGDMAKSDVFWEGGSKDESKEDFIEGPRARTYFVKLDEIGRDGRKLIDYDFMYYIITWELVGLVPCEKKFW
jgi:hypothetical protein